MWGKPNSGFMMFGGHGNQGNHGNHGNHGNQGNQGWNQQQPNQQQWGGNQQQQQQQQWSNLIQPYTQWFIIRGKQSGRALDIDQGHKTKGHIILWDIHGNDNQLWAIQSNGHGQCQLRSKTGTYLTIDSNNSNNEAKVIASQNIHAPGQIFQLTPVQGQQNCYYIKTFCGKCVDVYGHKKDNGAEIKQWEYNGGENQQFYIEHHGKGDKKRNVSEQTFALKGKQSGKALDVSQAPNTKDHTIIWDYHGGDNQKFRLQQNPMGLYSIKCSDGRYLTIKNNDANNGAKCVAEKWSGQAGQLFEMVPVQGEKNCFNIKTFAGKCLDVYGQGTNNETIVCQWEYNGQDNQKWYMVQ